MADTETRPGKDDSIQVIIDDYWNNGTSSQGQIQRTLDSLSVKEVSKAQMVIAAVATETFTPATVFGSAGNFTFVAVIIMDGSVSTDMQIELNNTGNLNDVANSLVYGGDASTSQIEIKNGDAADELIVYVILAR